jgi:hypothetical protein
MQDVNIHRRETLVSYYSQDSFLHDANLNAMVRGTVMHGLRILSAPDSEGTFKIGRCHHNIAEGIVSQDAPLLYSVRADDNDWFDKSQADAEKAIHLKDHPVDVSTLYQDFLDRVIETARNTHFQTAVGRDEPRLRGFHGG